MPGVSSRTSSPITPLDTATVVPGKLDTSTYSPVKALKKSDLPTLGLPARTILRAPSGACTTGAPWQAWREAESTVRPSGCDARATEGGGRERLRTPLPRSARVPRPVSYTHLRAPRDGLLSRM